MPSPPPEDAFNEEGTEIEYELRNTLNRVVDNYSEHWAGVLREILQNSYDGFCCNLLERETLPEGSELRINITVDTDNHLLRAQDNAGGMPPGVFEDNFSGLDTPSEIKASGLGAGGYGRGTHVVAALSNDHVMYAETHHNGTRTAGYVKNDKRLPSQPEVNFLPDGTYIEVYNCNEKKLEKLADWDRVKTYIQANFHPLLEQDNVTVEYTIDGESRILEPFNVDAFDVLFEDDIEFEYGGETHTFRDVVIYDQTSADVDVPINGVAMLKDNPLSGTSMMMIKDYLPRNITHRNKFFGFCNASDLCPEYEDSAHNDFTGGIPTETPLRKVLKDIELEHFVGATVDLNHKDEIEENTIRVVNTVFDPRELLEDTTALNDQPPSANQNEVRSDGGPAVKDPTGEGTGPGATTEQPETPESPGTPGSSETGEEDPEDGGPASIWEPEQFERGPQEETEGEEDSTDDPWSDRGEEPELSCTVRKRHYTTGNTARFWTNIENPPESDTTRFTLEAEIEHSDTGELTSLGTREVNVQSGEGTSDENPWTHTLDEEGQYTFTAHLFANDADDEAVIDTDATWVKAKPEDRDGEPADTDQEEENAPAPFLTDVEWIGDPDDPSFQYDLVEHDGGFKLFVNTRHPEYMYMNDLQSKNETEKVTLLAVRWALEALADYVFTKHAEDQLENTYTESGDAAMDVVTDLQMQFLDAGTATLISEAYSELTNVDS